MTWTKLLASHDVQRHQTSKLELDNMRALVARDLADAKVEGLSADRGLRRRTTPRSRPRTWRLLAPATALPPKLATTRSRSTASGWSLRAGAEQYVDYFETCRRKRNVIDYTRSDVATETEANEILEKATDFYELVEDWIDSKYPNLKR